MMDLNNAFECRDKFFWKYLDGAATRDRDKPGNVNKLGEDVVPIFWNVRDKLRKEVK